MRIRDVGVRWQWAVKVRLQPCRYPMAAHFAHLDARVLTASGLARQPERTPIGRRTQRTWGGGVMLSPPTTGLRCPQAKLR